MSTRIPYSSATIAPLGLYLPYIPHHDPKIIESLIRGFLLPTEHSEQHLQLSPSSRQAFQQEVESLFKLEPGASIQDISNDVLVFVCGHDVRDKRCGIIGPIVAKALEAALQNKSFTLSSKSTTSTAAEIGRGEPNPEAQRASVGLISHIGGHKFAGNVIIYLPASHPLSRQVAALNTTDDINEEGKEGISIWYGRVKPEHAVGIVEETVIKGVVIKELLRGIVNSDGEVVTLSDEDALSIGPA